MAAPKLRVLCLHGHHQNSTVFRQKTGAFRKAFSALVGFTFIDAPIEEDQSSSEDAKECCQTWFTTTENNVYKRIMEPTYFNGTFERSAAFLVDFVAKNGPFDGLFAFSQGAAFTHALLKQSTAPHFKFVILCSGFAGYSARANVDNAAVVGVPTLHIINRKDQVVPNELSEELAGRFTEPAAIVKYYDCGHCIPPMALCKADFAEFFKQFAAQT